MATLEEDGDVDVENVSGHETPTVRNTISCNVVDTERTGVGAVNGGGGGEYI